MTQFVQGFILQASLILALGAQNLFVLESGLRRRRHFLVATLCSICDAVLILMGVLGAATLFVKIPILKIVFGVLGVGFLGFYGLVKLKEKPQTHFDLGSQRPETLAVGAIIAQTLAFSLLNPHVYLDTLILIGGYSAKFQDPLPRAAFGMGAASFSVIWFFGLASLSASMSRHLNNPKTMRVVFVVSGTILILLAFKLGSEVFQWYQDLF